MKKSKGFNGNILIAVGTFFIVAAVVLVLFNFYRSYSAKKYSEEIVKKTEEKLEEKTTDEYVNPLMEMPVENIDGVPCVAVIDIPSLNLTLPVSNEWNYTLLNKTPCRYNGSLYSDDFVVCAHNYQYHFGGISKLNKGDEITLTDMNGNAFKYTVDVVDVLNPTDISEMNAGVWALTLFTCTPGGSYRVTVRCVRAD